MRKIKLNLGKWKGTTGHNNVVWIKKFENGVKIRKKGQGEISLNPIEVFELLYDLRKYPKKYGSPIFLTSLDLMYIYMKYTKTKEFVERLLTDEVTYEEKEKLMDEEKKRLLRRDEKGVMLDELEDKPKKKP